MSISLNEKLNYIDALEREGYSQDMIEYLVEGIENPDKHYVQKRYSCATDMMKDILNVEENG